MLPTDGYRNPNKPKAQSALLFVDSSTNLYKEYFIP